jgi:hydroxyacylglutathione hydrolase
MTWRRRARAGCWAALLAPLLSACAPHISREELRRRIEAGDPPKIVDVRSDAEFEKGHVPGAVHVPFWLVWSRLDQVPETSGEPIVVYCEHGPRAGMANFALWIAGRGPVVYLDGHMSAWKRDGLPVER